MTRVNRWMLALISVFTLAVAVPSFAASSGTCTRCLNGASSALHDVRGGLARHEFYEETKISAANLSAVKRIAKSFGADDVDSPFYIDYIDAVYRKIKASESDPIAAGEQMAQFGKKLDSLIGKMRSKIGKKAARFAVADAVTSLEEFKLSEFKSARSIQWIDSQAPYVDVKDYMKYVKGYIDDKPPWTTHPWGGSVLNQIDIRDGASHNMFPLQLNPHDMHHIHYAIGHPRPVAVYFKAARSHNAERFVTIGAMYEGVDNVQYSHEQQIAKYFAQQRDMDLEDAMVWIAKATKKDLDAMKDAAGITADIASGVQQLGDWAPTKVGKFDGKGWLGSLDDDVDGMVNEFEGYLQRPALNKYTYYARDPVSGQAPDHQKDMILYNERVEEKQRGNNGGN